MPYKSEKIKIAGTKYDKRRKLSQDQVNAIRLLKKGGCSYRQLAAMFNCSKWTIQNIIHPQPTKSSIRRPTAYWTERKRLYRQRKQNLYKNGLINEQLHKTKHQSKN